jgi:chloramphenicol 3-O phosphotransferase
VPIEVIVLNGGSSSGKSTIARRLQLILAEPWLTFGTDTLVDAMPPSLQTGGGIEFRPDGQVSYDLEVDTSQTSAQDCALAIAAHVS